MSLTIILIILIALISFILMSMVLASAIIIRFMNIYEGVDDIEITEIAAHGRNAGKASDSCI